MRGRNTMSRDARRPCLGGSNGEPCARRSERGKSRCALHEREVRRARNRERDALRPPSHLRGYGAGWKKLRAQVLAEEPHCYLCGISQASARVRGVRFTVDHVRPVALGGQTVRANLRAACVPCNARRGVELRERIKRARREAGQ